MLQFHIAWQYLIGEFTGILLLWGQPKIGIWIVWIFFFWTLYFIWMHHSILVFFEEFRWAAYQISLGRRKGGWRLLEGCFFGVNSAWERILIIDNLIRRGMVLANWCILRKNIKEMRISCFCIVHLLWIFFYLFLAFGVKWVMPNSQKCWKVCYDFGTEVPILLEIMECWSFFFNLANLEIEE